MIYLVKDESIPHRLFQIFPYTAGRLYTVSNCHRLPAATRGKEGRTLNDDYQKTVDNYRFPIEVTLYAHVRHS